MKDYVENLRVTLAEYFRARQLPYTAAEYGAMVANYYTRRKGHRPIVSSKQTLYPISDLHILDEYFKNPPEPPHATRPKRPRYLTVDSLPAGHVFVLESAREVEKKNGGFTIPDIRGLTASEYSRHGVSKRIQDLEEAGFCVKKKTRKKTSPGHVATVFSLTEKGWGFAD